MVGCSIADHNDLLQWHVQCSALSAASHQSLKMCLEELKATHVNHFQPNGVKPCTQLSFDGEHAFKWIETFSICHAHDGCQSQMMCIHKCKLELLFVACWQSIQPNKVTLTTPDSMTHEKSSHAMTQLVVSVSMRKEAMCCILIAAAGSLPQILAAVRKQEMMRVAGSRGVNLKNIDIIKVVK